MAADSSIDTQRELLEQACDQHEKWQRETMDLGQAKEATDRRLVQLLQDFRRRAPKSPLLDCTKNGYCFLFCPALLHPGRGSFPPAIDPGHCPAPVSDDPCRSLAEKAAADGSYMAQEARRLLDHSRCGGDTLVGVLARESCEGWTATWKGEELPAKPYVSTGDPKWCSMFEVPPPECLGAAAPTPTIDDRCFKLVGNGGSADHQRDYRNSLCRQALADREWAAEHREEILRSMGDFYGERLLAEAAK